eukprot:CAMPEP_0117079236 /NCGR_PEP_ID=MMETSP0472-20121206/55901_1 /TAXON_ID=693140 ORGANISM="Tiarina fusus, Strain LIS" /NCGR_SAMPLE_ID=MMETSP0472 /ASSEMBLY_ACC=CAM_ASM_000603 /LENGTH=380 /DNA_ID=CAMNT_0004806373 /DNA_START=9 /DNA_END=1148 /DNA_ORIENTATION=+
MRTRFYGLIVLLLVGMCYGASNFLVPMEFPQDAPSFPGDFNITGLSTKCDEQIADILVTRPQDYKGMLHAWGRSLGDTGLFYECSQISEAQYCLAMLDIVIQQDDKNISCSTKIPQCNIGVCVPSKCNQEDISQILQNTRSQIGSKLNQTISGQQPEWKTFCQVDTTVKGNPLSWIGMISLSLIIGTVLAATILHMAIKGNLASLFARVEVESFKKTPDRTLSTALTNLEFKGVASSPSDLTARVSKKNNFNIEKTNPSIQENSDELLTVEIENSNLDDLDDLLESQNKAENSDEDLEFALGDDTVDIVHAEDGETEEESFLIQEKSAQESTQNEIEKPEETNISQVVPGTISNNYRKLLNPIPGEFGSLNGLRFFSMMW